MHTTVIGGKVQAIMTERDIRIIWAALKAYEEFGLPSNCVGYLEEDELKSLLNIVTKTCNQHFHKKAISESEAKDRAERQEFYGKIHNIKRPIRLAKEKLEFEAKRRRTYEYGLSYDRPEEIKKPIVNPKLVKAKKRKKAKKICQPKQKKSTSG